MRKESLLPGAVFLCVCCLGFVVSVSPVFAGWPPCADTVRAVVVGSNINVYHDQAEWNCCATIRFDLDAHSDTFDLYESETYDGGPCMCRCCFDLVTAITDVTPGEYLVRVLPAGSVVPFGEVLVQVPEVLPWPEAGRSEPPGTWACTAGLGRTLQSPCEGWTTDVPEPPTTWGHIKTLFR